MKNPESKWTVLFMTKTYYYCGGKLLNWDLVTYIVCCFGPKVDLLPFTLLYYRHLQQKEIRQN